MTVERNYKCNLCGGRLRLDAEAISDRALGIWWTTWPTGLALKPARETENHLCPTCVSNIQAWPRICGQGYECKGGPKCGSDHK